jgi:integrase
MPRKNDPKPGAKLPWGEGSYVWDKRDPAGKRQRRLYRYEGQPIDVTGYSWAEVERKRLDAIDAIEAAKAKADKPADLTVAELCDAWHDDVSKLTRARKTRDGWALAIRLIKADMGEELCSELDDDRVRDFYYTLVDRPSLLKQLHYTLGMILDHGKLEGRQVKMPRVGGSVVPEVVNGYTLDEYERMLAYLAEHHSTRGCYVLTGLFAGMRPGEIDGLTWGAIDFKANTIKVATAMRQEEGGRRLSTTLKTDHKTVNAHRIIPLFPALRAALLREAEAQLALGTAGPEQRVFASVGRTHQKWGRQLAEAAGVRYISANGYRHTFGAIALHKGNDLHAVAALMGHCDLTMIVKVYSHLVIKPADIDITKFVGLGAVAHD